MKDDSDCSSLIKPGLDLPHRKNNKHLFKTQKPQHSWLLRSPSVVAKSTAVDSINYHTSQSSLLTSSSGGACPAFSPHYSYFTASANSHQWPASFCHAPSLHFISFSAMCACISVYLCVCARYCNVHVTSPKQASRKQMGSWKATSHIVTDEIPFFCPRSWWRWWLLSHSTGQTRGRSPTLCSHEQTAQMSTSSSNPLPFLFFFSPLYRKY